MSKNVLSIAGITNEMEILHDEKVLILFTIKTLSGSLKKKGYLGENRFAKDNNLPVCLSWGVYLNKYI